MKELAKLSKKREEELMINRSFFKVQLMLSGSCGQAETRNVQDFDQGELV
jgi:hypothetical protein